MVFRIDWHVDDDEWSTALNLVEHEQAGGTYDLKGKGLFLFLWGLVQFQYGLAHLFPRDRLLESAQCGRANHVAMGDSWYPITEDSVSNGAQLSILDFANQLVRIVHRLSTVNENETLAAGFSGNEGGFRINFERKGGAIVVDSRLFPDLQISVPADEFIAESPASCLTSSRRLISDCWSYCNGSPWSGCEITIRKNNVAKLLVVSAERPATPDRRQR